MSDRELTIANLDSCWSSCLELFGSLDDAQWDMTSLCPDWTVRGVAAHLVAAEKALSDWFPTGLDTPLPFDEVVAHHQAAIAMPADQLLADLQATFDVRRANLAATTEESFDTPSLSPVGPTTYGHFMTIREFDFWMHERDCRTPLAMPTDNGGPAAEMALDQVHSSIGYIAGKKVGLAEGSSIHFEITGAVERDIYVAVHGRAAEVDHVPDPTVTLRSDFMTFMNLACGRVDPEIPIAAGDIGWSGDQDLGAHTARNLRFTM